MATNTWIGGAPVVEQISYITLTGTWATGDILTVTINGKAMNLTVGTSATKAQIAIEAAAAWEGSSLGAGYKVNFNGTEAGEFYEVRAYSSGDAIYLTERAVNGPDGTTTEGRPFTFASTATTVGDGATTDDVDTDATGPHHWTNAANWATGSVPATGDTIDFDGEIAVKYGIDQSAVLTNCTLRALGSFTTSLGLPRYRTVTLLDGSADVFEEYLPQYLKINTGGTTTLHVGEGDGDGPTMFKLWTQTGNFTANVWKTGSPDVATDPAVFLVGGNSASQIRVFGGTVGFHFYEDDAACSCPTAYVAVPASGGDGGALVIGPGAGSNIPTSVRCQGGLVTSYTAVPAAASWIASDGGTINVRSTVASDAEFRAYGGTINIDGPATTIGVIYVAAGQSTLGSVNVVGIGDALTVTTCKLLSPGVAIAFMGYRVITFTNNIVLSRGLKPEDVSILLPTFAAVQRIELEALP